MTSNKRIVLCSHCAARVSVPADTTAKQFRCVKCGERTTIQLGAALAANAAHPDPEESVVDSNEVATGSGKMAAAGRNKVAVVSVIALIVLAAIAIGIYWQNNHDTQMRNAAIAASSSRAAADKAAADKAAAADQARRDTEAKRAHRAAIVKDIEASIKTMAQKHIADGLFDGPVLSVSCDPVGGGSTDDLTAKTTVFECFVATKNNGDGTMSGKKYHATMNWDTENYTYGFGPSR